MKNETKQALLLPGSTQTQEPWPLTNKYLQCYVHK